MRSDVVDALPVLPAAPKSLRTLAHFGLCGAVNAARGRSFYRAPERSSRAVQRMSHVVQPTSLAMRRRHADSAQSA
jgi:hypothetical protein